MHLFHLWETVRDCGTHSYERCPKCGKRRINHDSHPNVDTNRLSYLVDGQWFRTGQWTEFGSPPVQAA